MKLKLTLTVFLSYLFCIIGYAQAPEDCGIPSPPGADDCGDACVYCDLTANGYIGSTIGYTPDPPNNFCGTIENNQWFAFAAGTTTVEFTIDASNCTNGDGVQGAIYPSCDPNATPIVCEGGSNGGANNSIVVTANNLVVGQIYWFMVDGWLGDACDYEVTVTQGNTDPPPLDPPGPITPGIVGCEGETVTFMVPDLPGASYYEWTLPDGTVIEGQNPFVDYTFGTGGQVCVQANNVCNFSDQICITIDVAAPDAGQLSISPSTLCPGETANISVNGFNVDPDFTQVILITDASGAILEIISGGSGTFSHDECANFQICTYNYVTAQGTVPTVGANINTIDCDAACCEIECQDISFEDNEAPTFANAPADIVLTCFDLLDPIADLSWTDNCDGTGTVAGDENGNADLCNGGMIVRVWEYTDACGNTGNHQQTITVEPVPLAAFENPPGDISVSCDNIPSAGTVLTYTNNGLGACLITGSVTPTESGSADICGGMITYTWEFTDDCGRTIQHVQNVTVIPAEAPVFLNPPADISVTCENIPSSGTPLNYSNNGSGVCLIEGTVMPQESGSADICGGVITYTWTFTDQCNNTINHAQNVLVQPAPPPVFDNPPGDITVECDNIPTSAPDLNYSNGASGLCLVQGTISPQQVGQADECGGSFRFTWDFTDPCGNTISHAQNITVNPAPAPAFLNPPTDITVTCDNIPSGAPDLNYTNNALGSCLFEGTVSPVESGSADICGGVITYTWTFTDPCGNTINHVQNITVEPAPPAVFLNPPTDMNATCDNVPANPGPLQYTNNGIGNCLIDGSVDPVQSGSFDECGGTITYTWEFTDPCGNTINHVQNINIEPAPPATFTGALPQNITVSCDAVPTSAPSLNYSNNQSGFCEISGSVPAQLTGVYDECGGTLSFTWTFTDDCGRTIQHIQVITVEPAPIAAFSNPPGPQTLACADVLPVPPSLGYTNGASGLCLISGSVPAIQSGSYNECGGNITYTWTFTDDCNRTITHSQNITVEPAPDPFFVDLPPDITIDCGESFPPPGVLSYTNNQTGNCENSGTVTATVLVLNDLEQEYTWTFVNPCNGNVISHTQHITQNPAPSIQINPDFTIICEGGSFDLATVIVTDLNNTNPQITYHSGTPASPANQLPSTEVSPFTNTTYYILATNQFACSDELSFDVFIETPPNAGLDGIGNICFNTPGGINLFNYLNGNPDFSGFWTDASGVGVDVSNPFNVSLAGFPPGPYTFNYTVSSNGVCPDAMASVTLELLPEIVIDILEIACTDNPDFYNVIVNTNGFDILVNTGVVNDQGNGQVSISDIPIDESLSIVASNPGQFECIMVTSISPPDCDCPNVNPPQSNGTPSICEGETIPELTVTLEAGQTANWYDAPANGNLLAAGTDTYTPDNITAPGTYTFYVEAEDLSNGCLSSILTPVELIVYENPIANNASLSLCDDGDGFVAFDLSEANALINSTVGISFSYYENQNDAESGLNELSSPYTNIETPEQTLFVVISTPNACTDIAELTLNVLALPVIDVEVQNESCLGFSDGSVLINALDAELYSLDGIDWQTENSYTNLAAGNYTAYVENSDNCIASLDFTIEPGLELILNDFSIACNNNGTPSDATDDFYTVSYVVNNNQGITTSYTFDDGINPVETYNYGEIVNLEFPAQGQSLTLTFIDDINGCSIQQDIGPLNACSSDCLISIDQLDFECSDNGTSTEAGDDFYTITIDASAINGAANNTYNVLIDGVLSYNFTYGTPSEFTLPADNTSPIITVVDNADAACQSIQNIGPLTPCSDACIINATIANVQCDNQGTADNSDDDTYTFELTVSGINTSSNWETNLGSFSGAYDVPQTLGPFLISDGDISFSVFDADDPGCETSMLAEAPAACSSCAPVLDAGLGGVLTCLVSSIDISANSSQLGDYSWSGPNNFQAADLNITVTDEGWYFLQADYGQGCEAIDSVLVTSDLNLPEANAGDDLTITCQSTDVNLSGTGNTTSGNITYQWINQGNVEVGVTSEITVSESGIYTLIITDPVNGCTASDQVMVTPDADLPLADAEVIGQLTCENQLAVLNIGNSSTGSDISYEWIDENNNSLGTETEIEVNSPGNYTLIVLNTSNQCEASATIAVSENLDTPEAQAETLGVLSCDNAEVQLSAANSSGNDPLEFVWLNPDGDSIGNTTELTVAQAGTYTLLVIDPESACSETAQTEVTVDGDLPVSDIQVDGLLDCSSQNVILDGSGSTSTGNLTYEWQDDLNQSMGVSSTLEISTAGTFTLIITDAVNGCTAQASVIIEENYVTPNPIAEVDGILDCTNSEVLLSGMGSTGQGNLIFEWQNPNGDSIANTPEINVSESGIYTLVIVDSENGCTAETPVTVEENPDLPQILIATPDILSCNIDQVILDASASNSGADSLTFSWLDNSGMMISDSSITEVSTPGVYMLEVINTENGCLSSQSVEVLADLLAPSADAGNSATLTCLETMVMLNAGNSSGTGMLEFEWQDENGNPISEEVITEVTQPGIYSIIVTAENGCMDTSQVEVFISNDTPVSDAGVDVVIDCENSEFILGGTNTTTGLNIIYEWFDENNNLISNELTYATSSSGTYTLVVTNTDNDCSISDQVIVGENLLLPEADAGPNAILTCEIELITIGGNASSTGANYSYEWINSANEIMGTDSMIQVSDPDTYTLIVTDTENACTASSQVIVGENVEIPVADAGADSILTCEQTNILLDGSNSSGENLSFEWFDENNTLIAQLSTVEIGASGTYTLIVTDGVNGCTAESSVEIAQDNNLPQAVALADDILTCANLEVQLNGTNSSSQSGVILFEWFDENSLSISSEATVEVNTPGTYTLAITDPVNGCTSMMPIEVGEDTTNPIADAGENAILDCGTQEIILEGTGANGTNLSFEWFDDNSISISNTSSATVQSAGVYTLVVTNSFNGCTAASTVEVIPDNDLPIADAGDGAVLNCMIDEVILNGDNSSSGTSILYEWQDENGTPLGNDLELIVNSPGLYTFIVTDASNNCTAQDNVLVDLDITDPIANINGTGALNCVEQSLVLDATGSVPFGNLSFEWIANTGNIASGADTPNPEIDEPGIYSVIITNLTNGCTNTASITVLEDVEIPNAAISDPDELTCLIPEVMLDAVNGSGSGNYAYFWTSIPSDGIVSGANTLNPLVNQAGTYVLNILDLDNGCDNNVSVEVDEDIETPDAFASADDELDCITEFVQLSGEGSSVGTEYSYEWQGPGIVGGTFDLESTANAAGNYELIVTNVLNGCTETAIVAVGENTDMPTGLDLLVNPPPCFGDPGSVEIMAVQGGTEPYLYSLDGGANFYDITLFDLLDPGTYDVVVQDAIGCEYEEIVFVPETPELIISLGDDLIINLGEEGQLDAIVNIPEFLIDTVMWSPGQWLSCTDCLSPVASPLNEITYTVTVVNENGCEVTDQITLRVRKDLDVYIPNVFTPNGDGLNDVFMIFAGDNKVEIINSFQIFDRWGELVFEDYGFQPNDPAHSWDGTLRGEPMNPAVFVYWAEITFIDGQKILFKGDVTLVR